MISAHQNDIKIRKKINLKQRKKIHFFSKALFKQKSNRVNTLFNHLTLYHIILHNIV